MSGLLLAPYNDSMRLGQGYNSFLHTPCVYNAVDVDPTKLVVENTQGKVSQVVSYSSRLVTQVSELVRTMGVSAGSSIKKGSVFLAGNTQSVDTLKFREDHLNAVVSVKVVNQTTKVKDESKFMSLGTHSSQEFFKRYGDCYISGFIDGGELHGIVSMRVLDRSRIHEVRSQIRSGLNSANPSELTLGGLSGNQFQAALNETETTISVSWSGGGQIKPAADEWSVDTLFKAASAFPAHVAARPHHTWAILTKYTNHPEFLDDPKAQDILIPDFANVQNYASDLLDIFIGYKNNLATIQEVLAMPDAYEVSKASDPIPVTVQALIVARQRLREEMAKIAAEIDDIVIAELEHLNTPTPARNLAITPAEVWATRLPVLKQTRQNGSVSASTVSVEELLTGLIKVD